MIQKILSFSLRIIYNVRLLFFTLLFNAVYGRYASFNIVSRVITFDVDNLNNRLSRAPRVFQDICPVPPSLSEDLEREKALDQSGIQSRFGILFVKSATVHCPDDCVSWIDGCVSFDNLRIELDLLENTSSSDSLDLDGWETVSLPNSGSRKGPPLKTCFEDIMVDAFSLPDEGGNVEYTLFTQLYNFIQEWIGLPLQFNLRHVFVSLVLKKRILLDTEQCPYVRLEVESHQLSVKLKREPFTTEAATESQRSSRFSVTFSPIECRVFLPTSSCHASQYNHPTRDSTVDGTSFSSTKYATVFLNSPSNQDLELCGYHHPDVGVGGLLFTGDCHLLLHFEKVFYRHLYERQLNLSSDTLHSMMTSLELTMTALSWKTDILEKPRDQYTSSIKCARVFVESKVFPTPPKSDCIEGRMQRTSKAFFSLMSECVHVKVSTKQSDWRSKKTDRPGIYVGQESPLNIFFSSSPVTVECCLQSLYLISGVIHKLSTVVPEWCGHFSFLPLDSTKCTYLTASIPGFHIKHSSLNLASAAENYVVVDITFLQLFDAVLSPATQTRTLVIPFPVCKLTSMCDQESVILIETIHEHKTKPHWRVEVSSCGVCSGDEMPSMTVERKTKLHVTPANDMDAKMNIRFSVDFTTKTMNGGYWKNLLNSVDITKLMSEMRTCNSDMNFSEVSEWAEWECTFSFPFLTMNFFLFQDFSSDVTQQIKVQFPRLRMEWLVKKKFHLCTLCVADVEEPLLRISELSTNSSKAQDVPLLFMKFPPAKEMHDGCTNDTTVSPSCFSFLTGSFHRGTSSSSCSPYLHVERISITLYYTSTLRTIINKCHETEPQYSSPGDYALTEGVIPHLSHATPTNAREVTQHEEEKENDSRNSRNDIYSLEISSPLTKINECVGKPFVFWTPQCKSFSPLGPQSKCRNETSLYSTLHEHLNEAYENRITVPFKLSFSDITMCCSIVDSEEDPDSSGESQEPFVINVNEQESAQRWIKVVLGQTPYFTELRNTPMVLMVFSSVSGCLIGNRTRKMGNQSVPAFFSTLLNAEDIHLFRSRGFRSEPFQQVLCCYSGRNEEVVAPALELSMDWGSNDIEPLVSCRTTQFRIKKNSPVTWRMLQKFCNSLTLSSSSPATYNLILFPCMVEVFVLPNNIPPVNITTDFIILLSVTAEELLECFPSPNTGYVARNIKDYFKGYPVRVG